MIRDCLCCCSMYGALLEDLISVLLKVEADRRPSAEQILRVPSLQPYIATYVRRVARERGTGIDSPRIFTQNPGPGPTPTNTPVKAKSKPEITPEVKHKHSPHYRPSGSSSRKRVYPLSVRSVNTPSPEVASKDGPSNKTGKKKPTPSSGSRPARIKSTDENKENVRYPNRVLYGVKLISDLHDI